MSISREEHVYMAKLSEQAERYEDMVNHMKAAVLSGPELSLDDRNLFSVAYKNSVGARRASWRILQAVKDKEELKGRQNQVSQIMGARKKIEKELSEICEDALKVVEETLLPGAPDADSKVFFWKMLGDYNRYLAEFSEGESRKKVSEIALSQYTKASAIAEKELAPTSATRLGLILNFSVFYYEVMDSPELACGLAKQGFDDAIAELDSLGEDSYKDSTLIMQLLRDNLTLWTSDSEDAGQ